MIVVLYWVLSLGVHRTSSGIYYCCFDIYHFINIIMTCAICQSNRSNNNNNNIILLLNYTESIVYCCFSFPKKDDIDSSRWLFSNLPDLSLYFVLLCHLFVVSFTYHPSWLIVVLSYIILFIQLVASMSCTILMSPTIPSIPSYTIMT